MRVQAELVDWRFSVRVCFEGIPSHAWSVDTIAGILDEGCLVQDLEEPKTETKTACLCAWIWSEDPDAIPKAVHFQLEEPLLQNSPDSFWLEDLGESGLERRRTVSSKLLTYQVLIHLDQVLDSSPPPMEPVWGYSPSSQGSGMISSASVTEEVPKRHDIIWSLGVKDGQRAPREHVAARLGPGRNRSHSCSRSPPAHEHRRPSGWDVPPARTTAPTRRSSSRPPDHRGGSYGGYQRAATSPVRRERTRSPRNRQSPPPAPRPLVPQTASPPPPPSEGLTEFRPQESQIVPFPLTTPSATVLQVDQLANSIAGFDAPMMAIPLSVDPMLEEVGLGNIAPPPEQSLEQPQAQPPEQVQPPDLHDKLTAFLEHVFQEVQPPPLPTPARQVQARQAPKERTAGKEGCFSPRSGQAW